MTPGPSLLPQRFLRDFTPLPDSGQGKEISLRLLCHCMVYYLYEIDEVQGA
jgi:hypothetical protein